MKGYIFRGQATGRMWEKVFLAWPSDDDFKAALERELTSHAIVFQHAHDADGNYIVSHSKPRPLWVRVEEVEIVTPPGFPSVPELSDADKASRRTEMHGALSDDAAAQIVDRAKRGPVGGQGASVGEIVMHGVGRVINPGDPDHPDTPKAPEAMQITAADVGAIPASVIGSGTK